MRKIRCFVACACLVAAFALRVGCASSASAQTVLIDFGNDASYRGLSVSNPDTNGNYWNSLQPGIFVENLIGIDNTATTIDVGWDTPVGMDSYNGPAGPTDESTLETDVQLTDVDTVALGNLGGALEGAFDYITGPSLADNRVRFQIQELDPAKKYNLTFFGSHKFSNDATTIYSIYTDDTYTTEVDTASLDVQDPASPDRHNRDMVATISNLSPQTDNILYVQFVGSTGNLGYLNDMQIEAVTPELAGDYNTNGVVDAADFVRWRDNPGGFGGDPAGYNTWRANFGRPPGAGSALDVANQAAIPETA